ncbi:hypothetical protein TNCV_1867631 [Trichonephila clavipes]|nr:hypothetical protein TNCV_1867631 [Trichonephila clavipes]
MSLGLASKAIIGVLSIGEPGAYFHLLNIRGKDAYGSGNDLVLQDDNARPHMARIVGAYLEQETIKSMQWPA